MLSKLQQCPSWPCPVQEYTVSDTIDESLILLMTGFFECSLIEKLLNMIQYGHEAHAQGQMRKTEKLGARSKFLCNKTYDKKKVVFAL